MLGGWAIGLVGLFNIAGALMGVGSEAGLALLYALRAVAFVTFLAQPLSWVSVLCSQLRLASFGWVRFR